MTEFEGGMLVGGLLGVSIGVLGGGWIDRVVSRKRVVAPKTTPQPCGGPDRGGHAATLVDGQGSGESSLAVCPRCDGAGIVPYFPGRGYKGPNHRPCLTCKGRGLITLPYGRPCE